MFVVGRFPVPLAHTLGRCNRLLPVSHGLLLSERSVGTRSLPERVLCLAAESHLVHAVSRWVQLQQPVCDARAVHIRLLRIRGLNQLLSVCGGLGLPLWHS